MDKYLARDFLLNIDIHNTLSTCGRMASWGTWNPKQALGSNTWLVPVWFLYSGLSLVTS